MQPMDPKDISDGPTEFSYGTGMFPPGIAAGEGQSQRQDDFGEQYPDMGLDARIGDESDNYARAVADRRTDSTDPNSGRDFETAGNPDRYGAQPPLVRSDPERNHPDRPELIDRKLERKW